jgi:hypothetical protein
MSDSKRDTITRLMDATKVNGAAYLLVIFALGHCSVQELTDVTGDDDKTISKYLVRMESRGLVQRARSGKADLWFASVASANLLPKIWGANPSSSSDLISDQDLNLIRSDQSEEEGGSTQKTGSKIIEETALLQPARDEETEAERQIKIYLSDHHYHLTGDKRTAYVETDTIYAVHFEAWLFQVAQMQRDGVKIKHPCAYALKCCQKGERARPEFESPADRELETKLRYYEPDQKGGDDTCAKS